MYKILVLSLAAGLAYGCSKSKSKSKSAAAPTAPAGQVPIDDKSVLVIGKKILAATKTEAAAPATPDAALDAFTTGLYPKLRANCSAGCHATNQFPFASDGIPVAYQTAKKYMKSNPDESQMIINIKASHNGVSPALATDFAPLIKAVADEIAKQGG